MLAVILISMLVITLSLIATPIILACIKPLYAKAAAAIAYTLLFGYILGVLIMAFYEEPALAFCLAIGWGVIGVISLAISARILYKKHVLGNRQAHRKAVIESIYATDSYQQKLASDEPQNPDAIDAMESMGMLIDEENEDDSKV